MKSVAQLPLDFAMLEQPVPSASFPSGVVARSGEESDPVGCANEAAPESTEPALDAPSDRYLPPLGVVVARSVEAGEKVTLHFWLGKCEQKFSVELATPGLSLERRGLRVHQVDGRFIAIRWRDVYYVEAQGAEYAHYADPARLFNLPLKLARELLEASTGLESRECFELRESLRRALERPHLFNRAAYAPTFVEQLESRACDTELKLREVSDAPYDFTEPYVRACMRNAGLEARPAPLTAEELRVREELYAQVGVRISGEDGRATITAPDREHWRRALLALDHWPTYVNGVPVRRIPCTPARFEVALYELTACVGLGTGSRQRRTLVLTLEEAAARVELGKCPHYQYSRTADRWTEVG